MRQINWYGNDGRCNPVPGTVETAECGVCGAQMNIRRNVLGPTSSVEAMAGRKHRHDSFVCPRIEEDWHKRIYRLKIDVYFSEINNAVNKDETKKAAETEIVELLEAQAV